MFGLQPIVLVRNIFDVVVSIRDSLKMAPMSIAQAFVPADLAFREDEEMGRFITDLIVPWYFNFFGSWAKLPRADPTYL